MEHKDRAMSVDLIAMAKNGDDQAFAELVEPYVRELQVHCYRMLGSNHDAEDALQEALLAAWRGLRGFEEQASLRSWLYRVTTNRCLDALRSFRRRTPVEPVTLDIAPPEPTGHGEVLWLGPYPDALLEGLMDRSPGPEARYEAREAISLAFVTALQLLPARQRAALILRDVLGFRAAETAVMLEATEQSVTSALRRARSAVRSQPVDRGVRESAPAPNSAAEQEIVERLARAYEAGDIDGIVALLKEDVRLAMPPLPLEYQGREVAARFLQTVAFRPGRTLRLLPTRANGQPAFGFYVHSPHDEVGRAKGLLVLTLSGSRIGALTLFGNTELPRFGLPGELPPA